MKLPESTLTWGSLNLIPQDLGYFWVCKVLQTCFPHPTPSQTTSLKITSSFWKQMGMPSYHFQKTHALSSNFLGRMNQKMNEAGKRSMIYYSWLCKWTWVLKWSRNTRQYMLVHPSILPYSILWGELFLLELKSIRHLPYLPLLKPRLMRKELAFFRQLFHTQLHGVSLIQFSGTYSQVISHRIALQFWPFICMFIY